MADRKRLPVLKNTPEEEQGEPTRPPWHWVGFGTTAIVAAWVPLTYIAAHIASRWIRSHFPKVAKEPDPLSMLSRSEYATAQMVMLSVSTLAVALGAVFGGYIVGRWGGNAATARESAIAGFAASLIVSILAFAQVGISWSMLVPAAIITLMAWLGGRWGMRNRIAAMTPNMKQ